MFVKLTLFLYNLITGTGTSSLSRGKGEIGNVKKSSVEATLTLQSWNKMKVNILCYNIHSCVGSDGIYSVERVAEAIASSSSVVDNSPIDVVCLQEVENNHEMQKTRVWSEQHDQNQPEVLGEHLSMNVSFCPAIKSFASSSWEEHHGKGKGDYGIAILTKHKILLEKRIAFPRYKHKTLRNAMACLLQLPNEIGRLWIVNTHLGCHFIGEEQYQQSLKLTEFILSLPLDDDELEMGNNYHEKNMNHILGVIVCGDFNSPFFFSASTVLQKEAGMIDTWNECGNGGYGCTFPAAGFPGFSSYVTSFPPPVMKLDYIFYKTTSSINHDDQHKLKCTGTSVIDDQKYAIASDHLPILAQFSIT